MRIALNALELASATSETNKDGFIEITTKKLRRVYSNKGTQC